MIDQDAIARCSLSLFSPEDFKGSQSIDQCFAVYFPNASFGKPEITRSHLLLLVIKFKEVTFLHDPSRYIRQLLNNVLLTRRRDGKSIN